ncbi:FUSC family protein [Winogradskyella sp. PC D3.3]
MKKTYIVLGFTAAIIGTILATTPLYKFAFTPIVLAFVCGLLILNSSKKQNTKPKVIQYIFILVIISLSLTIYKGVIHPPEIDHTKQLDTQTNENASDSKETPKTIKTNKNL